MQQEPVFSFTQKPGQMPLNPMALQGAGRVLARRLDASFR
jgi:hypothetical protein